MSIENSLERIAEALEILSGKAEADRTDAAVEAEQRDEPEDNTGPAKKVSKKKVAKKKTSRKVGTKKNNDEPEKGDVRMALRRLQVATSPDKVKALLKKAGATGVGDLEIDKYQKVIDMANKLADEAE